jgi:hypothetical protein
LLRREVPFGPHAALFIQSRHRTTLYADPVGYGFFAVLVGVTHKGPFAIVPITLTRGCPATGGLVTGVVGLHLLDPFTPTTIEVLED